MRIRSTKPEFWSSRTISSVSWDARLVLKGIESYVDDNGVGRYDLELIVADLFPRDHFRNPPEVVARVSEAISELITEGLLWEYDAEDTSRGNRMVKALFVSNWEDLQRIDKPNKGRIRRPDGTLHYRESTIAEPSRTSREPSANPPEKVAPGTGEQGNRGTGEQGILKSGFQENTDDSKPEEPRPDVEEILDLLDNAVTISGFKKPTRTKTNRDAARLLIDLDNRSLPSIRAAIAYLPTDEFWRPNIRSMSKLREKWDQLEASAKRNQSRNQRAPKLTRSEEIYLAEKRRIQAAEAQQAGREVLTA